MKLTKELFEEGCKFKIIGDKKFVYGYEFDYIRKLEPYTRQEYMGEHKGYYIEESFACNIYKAYFRIDIVFFGISLSKKIYYRDCTVVE